MRYSAQYKSVEHMIWAGMISRCQVVANNCYRYYGARGIKVCERWQKLENFIADMGPRPSPKHSIDRIDVNGNYEPGNCRWATLVEQANNTRANRRITAFGRTQTMTQWSRELGINVSTILWRIRNGSTPEQAVSESASMAGSENSQAKLNEPAVRLIRADPRKHAAIAADFGISPRTVSKIKRGQRWAHIV
jgi:hypothetical protein